MGMNLIEKILAAHSKYSSVKPGDIIDVEIDVRAARDFGGPNVVKHLTEMKLEVENISKTFFTFDTNPTGSDQKYAANQQYCRKFARDRGIRIFDIDNGIGTHTFINEGLAYPGATAVTTDSHANILGAIGAFGQGMGDQDIAVAWHKGKVWFKVPESVKLNFVGIRPANITAKDIALNLLNIFGANKLLGTSVELYGEEIDKLTLDERITIASMGTEMGVIILLFEPNQEILDYCSERTGRTIPPLKADFDASYTQLHTIDIESFRQMISLPGKPHDTIVIEKVFKRKIDSAFIGSCTNGRIDDLRAAAKVLKGRKVAPGVVLKIVPATNEVWLQALSEGLIQLFKNSGAMVSNAGCAGCAAGQVGMNGPGEVTISTGNRNFPGKQGNGEVYLASPEVVAASAIAGYITSPEEIPDIPMLFDALQQSEHEANVLENTKNAVQKSNIVEGRVWYILEDNIDTDMIFHNRYLAITDMKEMGQYAFDNLKGYEQFAKMAKPGDIIVTGKNFGAGSSRQQAVDCFLALGVSAILAESYGAIYERNAINAALPILTYSSLDGLQLADGNILRVNMETGEVVNVTKGTTSRVNPFYDVQMEIYQNNGLF